MVFNQTADSLHEVEAAKGRLSLSWALSPDRIGTFFIVTVTVFFLVGATLSLLLRLELLSGDTILLSDATYNRLFSAHGLLMLFCVLLPAIPGGLGHFFLPRMLGRDSVAFPRLSLVALGSLVLAGLALVFGTLGGGVESTWTLLPPFSTAGGHGNLLLLVGVLFAAGSAVCLSLNLFVSVSRWRRISLGSPLPILFWSMYAAAAILLLTLPVLVSLVVLLLGDLAFGLKVFDPASGGDPALYRRLFWFFARPTFFALMLPALGVVSEIVEGNSRQKLRGDPLMVGSIVSISILSMLSAGAHLFSGNLSVTSAATFSLTGYLMLVPFGLILVKWMLALTTSPFRFESGLSYGIVFVLFLTVGGFSGLLLAALGGNPHLHGTVFVVGHLHFLLAGGVLAAYLGGIHYWWVDIIGRRLPAVGLVGASLLLIGVFLTFVPQFLLGLGGLPRRQPVYPDRFELFQILSSAGMTILLIAYVLPIAYLLWSLRFGKSTSEVDSPPDQPQSVVT